MGRFPWNHDRLLRTADKYRSSIQRRPPKYFAYPFHHSGILADLGLEQLASIIHGRNQFSRSNPAMIKQEDTSQYAIIERPVHSKPPRTLRSWFIGRPLSTADAAHQTIGKAVGLAVFASDALSSTAYATQEILVILAAAGTMAFGMVFPISMAIVLLLGIVTISYEQTIHAYPDGGGAYIVARDNLGAFPALIAGAALLT